MIDMHIHHTFWCFNENSSDTGGLVYDNFGKWDDVKYEFIKDAIWQDENGVFISLDHQRPIGANGQSLSDYYGGSHPYTQPTITTETTTPPVLTDGKPGDVDCNGSIDVLDAVMLARIASEDTGTGVTDQGKKNADCDGKSGVNAGDLQALLKYLAGLLTEKDLKSS